MEEIPIEMIFNWDQTGLNIVLVSTWTMASKEASESRYEILLINGKLLVYLWIPYKCK